MIQWLAPSSTHPLQPSERDPAGDDHPMRAVTRQIAQSPSGWSPERSAKVRDLFDGLAPDWHTRDEPGRVAPLADAWDRGGPIPTRRVLELGSGTGLVTPWLAERCGLVVAVDLSGEMLARAPRTWPRVRADGAHLPVGDGALDALVLVNAFVFPTEANRVVGHDGVVVWVCTRGADTPIYLPADEVAHALGSQWQGVASAAGAGTWAVLRRRA